MTAARPQEHTKPTEPYALSQRVRCELHDKAVTKKINEPRRRTPRRPAETLPRGLGEELGEQGSGQPPSRAAARTSRGAWTKPGLRKRPSCFRSRPSPPPQAPRAAPPSSARRPPGPAPSPSPQPRPRPTRKQPQQGLPGRRCATHRSRHWASLLPGTSSRILNQSCSPYLATAWSNFCRERRGDRQCLCGQGHDLCTPALAQDRAQGPAARPGSRQTHRVLLWCPEPLLQGGVQAFGPAVDELRGVPPLHVVGDCRQSPRRVRRPQATGSRAAREDPQDSLRR